MNRLLLALALVLATAGGSALAAPTPAPKGSPKASPSAPHKGSPSAAPTGANGLPADVDMRLMLFYRGNKPVGVSPIVRKNGAPLCPVRLAELLKFKVDYVQGARIATLTKASGETAVFKVGVKVAVVKTKAGAQRIVQMPVAPMILTPTDLKRATDRMWIPLDTVVELAGGKMNVEGRKVRIDI